MISLVWEVAEVRARAAEAPWEVIGSSMAMVGSGDRIRATLCMTSQRLGPNRRPIDACDYYGRRMADKFETTGYARSASVAETWILTTMLEL